jgi:GT2 family glycosyltransferase
MSVKDELISQPQELGKIDPNSSSRGAPLMKLSIVIICWNDLKLIRNCIDSIYAGTHSIEFEIIISDNGSTDDSVEFIRANYPLAHVIENGANLRFAKANNIGIQASRGEYILILNPDTIIHEGTLDKLIQFADQHPEAGAFGCKVLNPDGTYQESARPFPSVRGEWITAFCMKPLGYISDWFLASTYMGWQGDTQRKIDWQSGCCLLVRGEVLKRLDGFDPQFFYYYEEVDLCRRIWDAGYPIWFNSEAAITHLGGQSTKRFPVAFHLDRQITRYRYFYKYFGRKGVRKCRRSALVSLALRRFGFGVKQLVRPTEALKNHLDILRAVFEWNLRVDPVRLVENGEEPKLSGEPVPRVLER